MAALAARAKKKQGEAGNKKLIPTVFRSVLCSRVNYQDVGFQKGFREQSQKTR